jgi:hypothetical protein
LGGIDMGKKYRVNVDGDINNTVNGNDNKTQLNSIDTSVTKIKQIQKGKNRRKKLKNKYEATNALMYNKNNYDQNPSHNRYNIERLYDEGRTETMIAYVQGKRIDKETGKPKYVLYNVCTDREFMSDHVWVYPDIDMDYFIGKCIEFNANGTNYHIDKYGLNITNIKELIINKPFNFGFRLRYNTENLYNYILKANDDKIYEIVSKLEYTLECYSAAMFGSKRFIIGMIFNLFYLSSSNHELSTDLEYNIGLSKRMLIWVFSDIIYKLEEYRQNSYKLLINIDNDECVVFNNPFEIIHRRMLEICMYMQKPDLKNKKRNGDYGKAFNEFCVNHEINKNQAERFIEDNMKRFGLKKICKFIDDEIICNELIYSANIVIPEIYRLNKKL